MTGLGRRMDFDSILTPSICFNASELRMPVKNYIIFTWEDQDRRIDTIRLLRSINAKMQGFNVDRIRLVSEQDVVFLRDDSPVPMDAFLNRHYIQVRNTDCQNINEIIENYAEQATAQREIFLLVHVRNSAGLDGPSTYIMLFHHFAFDGIGVRLFLRAVERDYMSGSFSTDQGGGRGDFTPLSWFQLLQKYTNEEAAIEQAFWESQPWDAAEDLTNKHDDSIGKAEGAASGRAMSATRQRIDIAEVRSFREFIVLSEAVVYKSICELLGVEQTVFNTYVSCRAPLLDQNKQVLTPYNIVEAVPVFAGLARRPASELAADIKDIRSRYKNQGIGFRCIKYLGSSTSNNLSRARVPLIVINPRTYIGDLQHHFLGLPAAPFTRFVCGNYSVLVNASLDFTANGLVVTLTSDDTLVQEDHLIETLDRISHEIKALAP